jgi:hypothetical protein
MTSLHISFPILLRVPIPVLAQTMTAAETCSRMTSLHISFRNSQPVYLAPRVFRVQEVAGPARKSRVDYLIC